jgi:hypothetical protein
MNKHITELNLKEAIGMIGKIKGFLLRSKFEDFSQGGIRKLNEDLKFLVNKFDL